MNHEGLTQFTRDKLAKAKRIRRGASELAQTLRSLAAAPTSMSPQAPTAAAAAAAVPSAPEPPTSPSARVKPRKLSIQPGFVGSLP